MSPYGRATNYCRNSEEHREPRYVFFEATEEPPSMMLFRPWVWYRIPMYNGYKWNTVSLVGETRDERCWRLRHEPKECARCTDRALAAKERFNGR